MKISINLKRPYSIWSGSFGRQHCSMALPACTLPSLILINPSGAERGLDKSLNMKHVSSTSHNLCPSCIKLDQIKNRHHEGVSTSVMLPTDRLLPSKLPLLRLPSSVLGRWDHIVNLEDHLHHLRGKQDLLLLANQSFKDVLLLHVVGANIIAVYAAEGVALLQRCSVMAYHSSFQINTI